VASVGGGGGGGTYGTPGGHSPEVIGRRNTDRAGVGCAAMLEYRSRSASQSLRSSGVRSRGSTALPACLTHFHSDAAS